MAAMKTLVIFSLLINFAIAVQLQDSTFAMSLRVAKDEFDRSCKYMINIGFEVY